MINTDYSEAKQLLKLICEDTLVTFQTFDDGNSKQPKLAKIFHGLTDTTLNMLGELNSKGAGIFFTINETDGMGRKAENIIGSVRALVIDHDDIDHIHSLDYEGAAWPPHAVIESSRGKFHTYFKVSGISLDKFKELQSGLASAWYGDQSIKDTPRVMRLPGFYHQKNEPFLTRIISICPQHKPYTESEIREVIAAGPVQAKQKSDNVQNYNTKLLAFSLPEKIATGNRNDTIFRYACSMFARGVDENTVYKSVNTANDERCYEPLSRIEVNQIFESAKNNRCKTRVELPQYVTEMNKEYFVSWETGKTCVFHEKFDPALNRRVLCRSSFESFRQYFNKPVTVWTNTDGRAVVKKLGAAWLDHEERRQYKGILLAPPGMTLPDDYYNLWKGFGVQPTEGSWKLMQRHLRSNICDMDCDDFQYLIGWMANCVQRPSHQAEVAVVLRGKKGTGKSILGRYLCQLFGENSLHITSAKHLVGSFNSHLRSCIFLFGDESWWAGDKQHESVLKGLITESVITIEAKGIDAVQAKNMLHILMASNSDWCIPASSDERRFFVLDVSDKYAQNEEYFGAIVKEMDNGGLAAMLYDLLSYDLTGFSIRNVPQNRALANQKIQSLDPLEDWWYQKLMCGRILPESEGWNIAVTSELYEDYIKTVSQTRNRHSGVTVFGMGLKKLLPTGWPKKYKRNWKEGCIRQIPQYSFPDLDICRKFFSEKMRMVIDWEE